jgi:hypothetical protein
MVGTTMNIGKNTDWRFLACRGNPREIGINFQLSHPRLGHRDRGRSLCIVPLGIDDFHKTNLLLPADPRAISIKANGFLIRFVAGTPLHSQP